MQRKYEENLQLLPSDELSLRAEKIKTGLESRGLDAVLVGDNANLFYLTGRVFCGYVYLDRQGHILYFLRRPSVLRGEGVVQIRKPEDIAPELERLGLLPASLGLMTDESPWSLIERLKAAFPGCTTAPASAILREARAVKTPMEISLIRECGIKQTEVYRTIPRLYQEGMTDIEFQIEIERALRLHGCLGQFRVSGPELEIFMGNVLTGDNADAPSPYDFAMGGQGSSPSLPVGADGSIIKPSKPVMVDMNGNFNGYMTDMTRCYILGPAPHEAVAANRLSQAICEAIAEAARPGIACKELYALAISMVEEAGMQDYFMGHRYHAPFVGHGLGITINEPPVLAPRSRDVLQAGNVIALEPKFVLPGIGAVGVENTYVVEAEGPATRLTDAPQEIVSLR